MTHPLLQVRNLKKYFPIYSGVLRHKTGEVKAVDDISFDIYPGEVVGVVGESGSGKSTAGRAAVRLLEPTAGEIFFEGENFRELPSNTLREKRADIQMVFQDPYASLNPRKSIGESIGEPLLYHGKVKKGKDYIEQIAYLLELVGLSADVMDRYPHEFSGGQQQRICIGRALALRPKLIVCDEAVSALDVSVQAQVLNLLQELKEKMNLSYLFISHDLSVVKHICDRVIVLYLGKIMEQGTAEEVFSSPKHPYTQSLLSAIPCDHPKEKKKRIILKGEVPSPINPPRGCPFHTRCPVAEERCRQSAPPIQQFGKNHTIACVINDE